jgi:hypothetical protein
MNQKNIVPCSCQAEAGTDEMNDNISEYKHLVSMMTSAPKVPAPKGFTQNVMGRLPAGHGIWSMIGNVLPGILQEGAQSVWERGIRVPSKTECSFYFFITGFFYLIMALVLMASFKVVISSQAAADWIALQPHVTLGAAIWLLALGALLIMDGRTAIKIAQYGTLFYIFFAVLNGILIWSHLRIPYAGIFIIGFTGTSALMGAMLVLAVKKMDLNPVG